MTMETARIILIILDATRLLLIAYVAIFFMHDVTKRIKAQAADIKDLQDKNDKQDQLIKKLMIIAMASKNSTKKQE